MMLIWDRDDLHLSSAAMKIIGQGAATDLAESRGKAWVADEHGRGSSNTTGRGG